MEHAQELLPYLLAVLGFLFSCLATIGLWILNGIKTEIIEIKTGLVNFERRVSHLEGVVETHHMRTGEQ